MGELGIDPWGLAVQIIAFLIFIFLFWRYALGPITNMLDERSSRISESMAAAGTHDGHEEHAGGHHPPEPAPGAPASAAAGD